MIRLGNSEHITVMKMIKGSLIWLVAFGLAFCAARLEAQTKETLIFNSFKGAASLSIPDGDASGVNDLRTISSSITSIGSIRVTLDISADFNGDVYGFLSHGNGFSVLLNREGRSNGLLSGYGDSGMSVTLSDTGALGDIHRYQTSMTLGPGQPLTGIWQPDARNVDPGLVFDSSPRSAFLNVFDGKDANGMWTLYLADMQTGGNSALNRWSLEITGVPEPRPLELLFVAGLCWIGFAIGRSKTP